MWLFVFVNENVHIHVHIHTKVRGHRQLAFLINLAFGIRSSIGLEVTELPMLTDH